MAERLESLRECLGKGRRWLLVLMQTEITVMP